MHSESIFQDIEDPLNLGNQTISSGMTKNFIYYEEPLKREVVEFTIVTIHIQRCVFVEAL